MIGVTRSTPPRSNVRLVGARKRASKAGWKRQFAGISIMNGGGIQSVPPAMPASGSAKPAELMRILVTGTSGQVATSLAEKARERPDIELLRVGRPEIDLLSDAGAIADAVAALAPDVVVSAAAYTQVDQ